MLCQNLLLKIRWLLGVCMCTRVCMCVCVFLFICILSYALASRQSNEQDNTPCWILWEARESAVTPLRDSPQFGIGGHPAASRRRDLSPSLPRLEATLACISHHRTHRRRRLAEWPGSHHTGCRWGSQREGSFAPRQ